MTGQARRDFLTAIREQQREYADILIATNQSPDEYAAFWIARLAEYTALEDNQPNRIRS